MDESLQEHLKALEVGKLKLSEAIRIGARLRPQAMRMLFRDGATCALGAAAEARGWIPKEDFDGIRVKTQFLPELVDQRGIWDAIGARNDVGESRESIADWLESKGL